VAESAEEDRWRKTARLSLVTLAASALAAIVLAAISVSAADEAGFPLAHVLVTALLPVGLTAAIFWFCDRQQIVDRDYGHNRD
jgi:hypothetical protein